MLNKQTVLIPFLLLLTAYFAHGQIDQVSVGQQYTKQTFYSLGEGALNSVDNAAWDIAFSSQGVQDAGIFVNESAALTGQEQVEVYIPEAGNYEDVFEVDTESWQRLYNPEVDWQNGAFNSIKNELDVFDYGWGQYNPSTNTVVGKQVYFIKLRDGRWKKLFVENLFFDWNFKYADLNGENEVFVTIPKADHIDNVLAYFSFESGTTVDVEPTNWDLLLTRYNTYTDDGMGNFENYVVTGLLSGLDVQVAEKDDVDPELISHTDVFEDEYEAELDVIGFDWKTVDFNTSLFTVDEDRVYFVKNADNNVCKVQLIDFEGALTGVVTLKKECSIIASTDIIGLYDLKLYPNPTTEYVQMLTDFREETEVNVSLVDMNGKVLMHMPKTFASGFRQSKLPLGNVPDGRYNVVFQTKYGVSSQAIIVIN